MYWICVSVSPYFLQSRHDSCMQDLFLEIFGDDYIDHYLVDYDEFEKNYDIDRYVFVHCRDYESHTSDLRNHRHIKNVLNSFNDIVTIPEKEILETKTSVSNIIEDDGYCINRTGFFIFGDIVKILRGSLSSMNGIVISRDEKNPEFYNVYFRLFVHKFYKQIHISNMQFDTSIFKFIKIPIEKRKKTESEKRIKKIIKKYDMLSGEFKHKRLVDREEATQEVDLDVANLISSKRKKRGVRKNAKD